MKQISINNGGSFIEPAKAIAALPWAVIVSYMDDNIREDVHFELAPCEELEFLVRYLELAEHDLIIG
jgi:hypothetical protein|nr:MAG TPA: hypothetical protein [Caudoviricetes sp.]